MVRLLFFLIISLFCGCTSSNRDISERQKFQHQAIFDFEEKIKNKGFRVSGVGGAEKEGKTWQLKVNLDSNFELTVPVARSLIVELSEQFLREINSNEKLKPYLIDYPFTTENLQLCIFGKQPQKTNDFLLYVSMDNSHVSYRKDNPNGGKLIPVLDETYEEAKKQI